MSTIAIDATTLIAKIHENKLKHLNFATNGGYCALFVVNTPIADNSGVAHGVEHFVFRRSLAFTQPESLFQITALTDVKINASTLENVTYFHCQSQCQQTFLVSLNYLLNGVLHPIFTPDDINFEIHDGGEYGVIYRELLGIELLKEQSVQQVNKEKISQDVNQQKSIQYGGDRNIINQLTVRDLHHYHQQFYQAKNITLVTENADFSQVSELIKALPEIKTLPGSSGQAPSNLIKKPTNQKPSNDEITCNNDEKDQQQKKYSKEINHLVELYHQWLSCQPQQSLDTAKNYKLATKRTNFSKKLTNSKSVATQERTITMTSQDKVISPLSELAARLPSIYKLNSTNSNSLVAQSKLPVLFNDLFKQAQHQLIDNHNVYVTDQQNGLFLATLDSFKLNNINQLAQSYIASYIISAYPTFLTPRCQGHCYSIQALVIKNNEYFSIYSAFDINATKRNEKIAKSLLQLSKDLKFINDSIILAKIKYCRAQQLSLQQLDNITPTTTASFICILSQLV